MTTVSEAASEIRNNLEDGWRSGVSRGDLQENNEILEGLTRSQTNDVIETLTDSELNKWTDEIYDGKALGIFGSGGLSADERHDLYDNLARDLDAEQLNRVYDALGDEDRQAELLTSITNHSTDFKKAALVEILASSTTDKTHSRDSGFFSSTTEKWDQDAKAVSTLIGSMTIGSAVERSINALNNTQLQEVLSAGIQHRSTTYFTGHASAPSNSFDTRGITALLSAVGRSDDQNLKARVFEFGARQIDEIRGTDHVLTPNPSAERHAGEVATALSQLLDTDTTGIIASLERGDGVGSSEQGNGISSFLAEMVRQDNIGGITDLIARLQSGNNLDQDPVEYLRTFTETDGRQDYQNASSLGYLIGGVREGIEAIETDQREQAELISTIFGTALGLGRIPKISAGAKAASIVVGALSKEVISDLAADLGNGHLNLGDALEAAALPAEINSSDVTDPFRTSVQNVVRN